MKIAVCISGHLRNFEQTYPSFEKYFLNRYDCDIFIHTWDKLGYQSRFRSDIISDNTEQKLFNINCLYKPKKIIIEDSNFMEELKNHAEHYAKYLMKEPKPPHHMAAMFYKIFACNEIRKQYQIDNEIQYDWVVRTRADLLFHDNINIPTYDIENTIFIPPSIYHPQWYNDQFAIATPNNMDVYSAAYFDIPNYFQIKEEYYPEKFMMWTLKNKGFSAAPCDGHFSILR